MYVSVNYNRGSIYSFFLFNKFIVWKKIHHISCITIHNFCNLQKCRKIYFLVPSQFGKCSRG